MERLSAVGQQHFERRFKEELNRDAQQGIWGRGISINQEKILRSFWMTIIFSNIFQKKRKNSWLMVYVVRLML